MMTPRTLVSLFATVSAGLSTAACQTGGNRVPATLEQVDEATLANVKEVLSGALGRAKIRLGPEDPAVSSTISVLPPPLGEHETRSPAMPAVFDIMTDGEACFLVSRESGESYRLDGASCAPVAG